MLIRINLHCEISVFKRIFIKVKADSLKFSSLDWIKVAVRFLTISSYERMERTRSRIDCGKLRCLLHPPVVCVEKVEWWVWFFSVLSKHWIVVYRYLNRLRERSKSQVFLKRFPSAGSITVYKRQIIPVQTFLVCLALNGELWDSYWFTMEREISLFRSPLLLSLNFSFFWELSQELFEKYVCVLSCPLFLALCVGVVLDFW